MAVQPIPDGYPRLIPYLAVHDAAAAIGFYCGVLGATERMRLPGPDGKIAHAELNLGDSVLMLADEFPEMDSVGPKTVGGSPVSIVLYVDDVDAVHAAALQAGATETSAPSDQFYGDRSGAFTDPFGHKWNIMTHVEDVSPEEMQARMASWTAPGGGAGS